MSQDIKKPLQKSKAKLPLNVPENIKQCTQSLTTVSSLSIKFSICKTSTYLFDPLFVVSLIAIFSSIFRVPFI